MSAFQSLSKSSLFNPQHWRGPAHFSAHYIEITAQSLSRAGTVSYSSLSPWAQHLECPQINRGSAELLVLSPSAVEQRSVNVENIQNDSRKQTRWCSSSFLSSASSPQQLHPKAIPHPSCSGWQSLSQVPLWVFQNSPQGCSLTGSSKPPLLRL